MREDAGTRVWRGGTVVERRDDELWWWSWAGANATLAAALPDIVEPGRRTDNHRPRLRQDTTRDRLRAALDALAGQPLPLPAVTPDAVEGLKFGEVLPPDLATDTLVRRMTDHAGATKTINVPIRWVAGAGWSPRLTPARPRTRDLLAGAGARRRGQPGDGARGDITAHVFAGWALSGSAVAW